jgi:hypothetical protein
MPWPRLFGPGFFLRPRATQSTIQLYQDNQSAILLEKNGRASSSKRTRHINIRYFFVTDRIANKELSVEYCPTGNMMADFYTKPLQGTPFCKFRDQIMNIGPTVVPPSAHRSVLEPESGAVQNTEGHCVTY